MLGVSLNDELFTNFAEMIQEHPKDIFGKLGERVEFSIKTNPIATSYQWYFNRIPISPNDQQYEGSATDTLIIKECLLECEVGFFYCEVTDKFGGKHTSKIAKLIIGECILPHAVGMHGYDFQITVNELVATKVNHNYVYMING